MLKIIDKSKDKGLIDQVIGPDRAHNPEVAGSNPAPATNPFFTDYP